MNIAEIAAEYIADKRRVRRESTVEGYESVLRCHVLPRWGDVEIDVTRPAKAADTAVYPDTLGAATEAISDASSVPVLTGTSRVRDMESPLR